MKTVNEIKGAYELSRAINGFSQNDMNELIFMILIGITEHLEAQPEPTVFQPFCQTVSASDNFAGESVATVSTTCDACKPEIRREAMIEALRWADRVTQSGGVEYSAIGKAIARLENGGSL